MNMDQYAVAGRPAGRAGPGLEIDSVNRGDISS